MTDFIVNPRRAPRAPARCRARVQAVGPALDAETEDVSPTGCQLVLPAPLPRGAPLMLALVGPGVREQLALRAKVAWVSSQPPWRIGVAFDEAGRPAAARWFDLLLAARPGLGNFRRVPERLPVDAMVFLAPPPRFADFTAEEVALICHVAAGATIAALRERLSEVWPATQRALFALLSRGVLTVARGAAAHPEAWRAVMAELDARFVLEAPPPRELPGGLGTVTPPPPWRQQGAPLSVEPIDLPPLDPSMLEGNLVEPSSSVQATTPPPLARVEPAATPAPAPAGSASAGTGWRGAARARSAEAQEAYDLGRQELTAGRSKAALALLRRALQLAPGDAEVAAALGEAMKG